MASYVVKPWPPRSRRSSSSFQERSCAKLISASFKRQTRTGKEVKVRCSSLAALASALLLSLLLSMTYEPL